MLSEVVDADVDNEPGGLVVVVVEDYIVFLVVGGTLVPALDGSLNSLQCRVLDIDVATAGASKYYSS